MEAAAMTAGPVRNLTAIAKAATEFPHAIILGCKAMNSPAYQSSTLSFTHTYTQTIIITTTTLLYVYVYVVLLIQ